MYRRIQIFAAGLFLLSVASIFSAFAAGVSISPANVGTLSLAVSVDDFKPSACSGLALSNLVTGTGTITGTAGNDLILGSADADTIDGMGGNDCILGGGGDDTITGGADIDVCLGGPDNDSFLACEAEYP